MENQQNPLKSYFRKPGIWIKLPSQGMFYTNKPAELNDMGEIPVYPMTAKDELMLKNADALLNGTAVYDLIRSCAPAITNPEQMPCIDLDAVLLAIKRCTYGSTIELDVYHDCKEDAKNEISVDLNHMISSIKVVDKIDPIVLDNGIRVFIRPVNVKQLLHLNWVQFEKIRNLQLADQQGIDEKTKTDLLQKSYQDLTAENINIVSECIDTVLLPDGISVTDQKNIREWAADLSRTDFKQVETAIMSVGSIGVQKTFTVQCQHCGKDFEGQLDLNPTTFFA